MALEFDTVEHENLGEIVFNKIADALIRGNLQSGDRVRIRKLANEMGLSVTPVRDAILRLVQDQALVLLNSRDIRVRTLTLPEYVEIRNIRVELEGLAAEEAARCATPADIAHLEELLKRNELALAQNSFKEAVEINQLFHFAMADIAKMPTLKGILKRLWLQMGPLIASKYEAGGRSMIEHHYPIVAAIRAGDAQMARQAIREDIMKGGLALF
ncbi:MAG: GntR family transcriptional regulator [Burkholderiales bacterium]